MAIRPFLTALALSLLASAAHADAERTFWEITSDGVYAMVGAGELAMALDGRDGRQAALQGLEALAAQGAATELLKWTVREKRPNRREFDSFPSLHASTAFCMAKVIRQSDPHWAPYAYVGAGLIAASRVQLDEHHWQDVVAGAALGYVSGHYLAKHHVSITPRSLAVSFNF